MAAGRPRPARRRRRGLGDGHRRAGRRHRGEAGRARVLPRRRRPTGSRRCSFSLPGDRERSGPARPSRRCTSRRTRSDTKSARRRMTSAGSVGGDDRLRLFLALQLPAATLDVARAVAAEQLLRGPIVAREHLHVTLAFLGSRPAHELPRSSPRCATPCAPCAGSRSSPRPGARRAASGWSSSATSARGDRARRAGSTSASRRSASTGASRGRGSRTSPCCGSASGRGSTRRCRRREHSFRPMLLLTYLACTRPAPGTRCSNRLAERGRTNA